MMEKKFCTDCGHSFSGSVMKCRVSKTVRTFYSDGRTQTTYRLCDDVNTNGLCGKYINRVGILSYMVTWWQNWWDNYYKSRGVK